MKYLFQLSLLLLTTILCAQTRFNVSSVEEFDAAHDQASAGDSIVWEAGTYSDIRMDISKEGLIVTAAPYGTVMFTGLSRAVIDADHTTFSGFQYIGGNISTLHVITINSSDVLFTHINIQNYTCHKYLIVNEDARRVTISYSNFENRLNRADQNILSILVDRDEPGFHKIQYCSFKNFDGTGNDLGIEPIRIGVSTQAEYDSRTLVEYCYFTNCNGDGELISYKAAQNVIRYNTFENNPVAELVLRHGDEAIVYGNFFINNMGGIRVREGSNHYIFNNYFEGINRRAIYLQNDPSDPLSNIHVYFNTIVNSADMILGGGSGSNPPTNVTIANNIFANPQSELFEQATGTETWVGNLSFGTLGIDRPSSGLSETDPLLEENSEGFFQPASESAALANATDGFPEVPLFEGLEYDHEILLDLMQSSRPEAISDRAIGASEFSATVLVQPHVNEMNTGPSYLFDNLIEYVTVNDDLLFFGNGEEDQLVKISSNVDWTVTVSDNTWIFTDLTEGSGDASLSIFTRANEEEVERSGTVTISGESGSVTIDINQRAADPVILNTPVEEIEMLIYPNPTEARVLLKNFPVGTRDLSIKIFQLNGKPVYSKIHLIDQSELIIQTEEFPSGTYILKGRYIDQTGTFSEEFVKKLVIK
ncbi:MAG: chondroitinase-B domain-containing protein [Cytophagales bacterium]|nr:chondroitinase-B domain-containing protein [Cytophagales bacterium]